MLTLKDYRITYFLKDQNEELIREFIFCVINYNELLCKIERLKESYQKIDIVVEDIKIEFLKEV